LEEIRIPFENISDGVTLQTGRKYRIVLVRTLRVELFLHDVYQKPLPDCPYELKAGGRSFSGKADGDAKATVTINSFPERCTVRWSSDPNAQSDNLEYEREIFLHLQPPDTEEGQKRRLHNLGLPSLDDMAEALGSFQRVWDLEPTEMSDDKTVARLEQAAREKIAHEEQPEGGDGDESGERT
jgi:hypothetical protein